MRIDWSPLRRALAGLRAEHVALPIWWRDDDAVAPTAALEQLNKMSDQLNIPVHLAVVPKHATDALAAEISRHTNLIPVTHGWAHEDHSPADQKKSEFGTGRVSAKADITDAATRMRELFGDLRLPLFVPPWNRLWPGHYPALRDVGFKGISTFGPRPALQAADGLLQINTHVDPIDWHGTRDLLDPEIFQTRLRQELDARRCGTVDASEPLGYLTHHLVHSRQVWDVSQQLLTELLEGGAHVQPLAPYLETLT